MPYRLYLDTSVFGALFDEEDPERVALTRSVLRRIRYSPYQAFIGTPILEEIALAPPGIRRALEGHIAELSPALIEEGAASLRLAESYLKARLVPPLRRNDARHIALATVADLRCDRLLELPGHGQYPQEEDRAFCERQIRLPFD